VWVLLLGAPSLPTCRRQSINFKSKTWNTCDEERRPARGVKSKVETTRGVLPCFLRTAAWTSTADTPFFTRTLLLPPNDMSDHRSGVGGLYFLLGVVKTKSPDSNGRTPLTYTLISDFSQITTKQLLTDLMQCKAYVFDLVGIYFILFDKV